MAETPENNAAAGSNRENERMTSPLHEDFGKSQSADEAQGDAGHDPSSSSSSSSSSSDEERIVLSSSDESSISSLDEDERIATRIIPPLHKHHSSSHSMSQEEALCLYQDRSKYRTDHSLIRKQSKNADRRKRVRFATHAKNDKVWSFVKASPKYPDFLKDDLWWSKSELEDCYDEELKFLETYQRLYKSTLRNAFLSCKDEEIDEKTVALCFHSMLQCSDVRGLEREVVPQLKHYKKKHRRAVMAAIETSHNLHDPKEWEFIRDQSVAFSRPCRLVMTKLGEFDQLSAWPESAEMPPPITPSRGNRRPLRRTYSYSSSDNETTPENRRGLLRRDNSAKRLGDLDGQDRNQIRGNRKPLLIDDDDLSLKGMDESPRRNSWTLSLPDDLLANSNEMTGNGAESDSNLSLQGNPRRRLRRSVQRHDSTDSGDLTVTEDRRPQFRKQLSARAMQQNHHSDEQPSQPIQQNADSGDEEEDAPDPSSLVRSNRTFRRQFRRRQAQDSSTAEDRRSLLQKQDSAKGMPKDGEARFSAPKRQTSDSSNESNRWGESPSSVSSNTPSRKIARNRTPRRHLKRNPKNLDAYLAPGDNDHEKVTSLVQSESSLSSHESGPPQRINLPERRRSNSIESQSSQDTAPQSILSSEKRQGQWQIEVEKPTTFRRVSSADSLSSLDSAPRPVRRSRETRRRPTQSRAANGDDIGDNLDAHSEKSQSSNESKNSRRSENQAPILPRSDSMRSLASHGMSDAAPRAPIRRTPENNAEVPSRGVMQTNSSRSTNSDSAPKIARRAASPVKEPLSMEVKAS